VTDEADSTITSPIRLMTRTTARRKTNVGERRPDGLPTSRRPLVAGVLERVDALPAGALRAGALRAEALPAVALAGARRGRSATEATGPRARPVRGAVTGERR
jgi:hypothetical protein